MTSVESKIFGFGFPHGNLKKDAVSVSIFIGFAYTEGRLSLKKMMWTKP